MLISLNNTHCDTTALRTDNNFMVVSALTQFYSPVLSRNFSIKFVYQGMENYNLNGNFYSLRKGQYLLTNGVSEGHVTIDSKEAVKGICINILPSFLSAVVASFQRPDSPFPDEGLDKFFTTAAFLENQYLSANTSLGQTLEQISCSIENGKPYESDNDSCFYHMLSEKIVSDHIPIYKQLQSIGTLKSSTKNDLLKRVSRGKEFIDCYFRSPLEIQSVAREASVSEYHFFRLFKAIYGLSPHQYIIRKRLNYGYGILQQNKTMVSEAAIESGFSDIYTFSKAFKKYFHVCPSSILIRN